MMYNVYLVLIINHNMKVTIDDIIYLYRNIADLHDYPL